MKFQPKRKKESLVILPRKPEFSDLKSIKEECRIKAFQKMRKKKTARVAIQTKNNAREYYQ